VNNLSIERDNTEIVLSINGESERLSLSDAVVFVSLLTAKINEALAVTPSAETEPVAEPEVAPSEAETDTAEPAPEELSIEEDANAVEG
jgi:hypothetical protein